MLEMPWLAPEKLGTVLQTVRERRFNPDASRSGRWVPAAFSSVALRPRQASADSQRGRQQEQEACTEVSAGPEPSSVDFEGEQNEKDVEQSVRDKIECATSQAGVESIYSGDEGEQGQDDDGAVLR